MAVVKSYAKGQIALPKKIRDALGITAGKRLSVTLVGDHVEVRMLPDDPIEHLTGIFKAIPKSMASELLEERSHDDRVDEKHRL
jgi:AbrB family looped-hinge helix DNA binding protein